MPQRFDTTVIEDAKIKRTPSGGARVDGILTRTGVYNYTDENGKTIREYRPPEEVFKPESMATLDTAAVTIGHPRGMVTADNWQALSIGFVVQPHKDEQAKGVGASVVIQRADAVRKLGTELRETSCGYQCRLDMTPGTTPTGEAYDCIQRDIEYNHVGLGRAGWGRQGPQSALRLDSAGDEIPPAEKETKTTMFKIKFDGKEFSGETSEAVQAQIDAYVAAKGATDTQKKLDEAEGQNAVLKQQLKVLQDGAASAPEAVRARVKLEEQAGKILGAEVKLDALTDRAIRVETIKRYDAAFAEAGKSDDYVTGVYDQWVNSPAGGAARRDSLASGLTQAARGASTETLVATKNDGLDRENPSADAAKAKMISNLGKMPQAQTAAVHA